MNEEAELKNNKKNVRLGAWVCVRMLMLGSVRPRDHRAICLLTSAEIQPQSATWRRIPKTKSHHFLNSPHHLQKRMKWTHTYLYHVFDCLQKKHAQFGCEIGAGLHNIQSFNKDATRLRKAPSPTLVLQLTLHFSSCCFLGSAQWARTPEILIHQFYSPAKQMVCANSRALPRETDYKPSSECEKGTRGGGDVQFNEKNLIQNCISSERRGDGRKWCTEQLILMSTPGQGAYRWFTTAARSRSHSAAFGICNDRGAVVMFGYKVFTNFSLAHYGLRCIGVVGHKIMMLLYYTLICKSHTLLLISTPWS